MPYLRPVSRACLEDAHIAEPGHLIEQEQDSGQDRVVRLIDGVEQGADENPADGRGGQQHGERDLQKNRDTTAHEVIGAYDGRAPSAPPETRSA